MIKFLMGILVGVVAHKMGHITTERDLSKVFRWTLAAVIAGLAFNAVFDPTIRYFYKILILGKPAAEVSFAINIGVTLINSVVRTLYGAAGAAQEDGSVFLLLNHVGLETEQKNRYKSR